MGRTGQNCNTHDLGSCPRTGQQTLTHRRVRKQSCSMVVLPLAGAARASYSTILIASRRQDQRMGKGKKSRNQSDGPISKRHHKRLTSEIQNIGARSRGLGIRKLRYGTNAQSSTLHGSTLHVVPKRILPYSFGRRGATPRGYHSPK